MVNRTTRFLWSQAAARCAVAAAIALAVADPREAIALPAGSAPAAIASRDLRPGMTGYGLTVVRGTKVERFDVTVIGVLEHALPHQDIILIRIGGLGLEHSGVVAGMSGSPVYVVDAAKGDLLVGALSYGFPFNKDPVAGVTPIADMLPELDRPLVPPPLNQRFGPAKKTAANPFGPPVAMPGGGELQPVAVPLVVSGFHPQAFDAFKAELADLGFSAVQLAAGGSTPASRRPSPAFEPGSAISLALARGDMSVSGIGTVTWVRGDRFIAFGHPFKALGQVHLPVGGADIQWILASLTSSFKMGNALEDIGILDQDRQPAVAGRTGVRAQFVPIRVAVRVKDTGAKAEWNVEVADQPLFFPLVAAMVVGNAARVAAPVSESLGVEMKLRIAVDGHGVVETRDVFSGLSGMQGVGEIAGVVGNYAKAITFNGFERLRVGRIDAEIEVSEARNLAFLEWVRTQSEEVEVGQPIAIKVGIMRANVQPPLEVVTLTLPPLPAWLAGSTLTVQVGSEKAMAPEFPEPANVDMLLEFLRGQPSRSRLAAVVALPEPTLMLRGARLSGLPIGVRDELQGHQVTVRTGKDTVRTVVDLPWVINGSGTVRLRVRP